MLQKNVGIGRRSLRALIMLDVDGFGKVNDVFGHTDGDTVLKYSTDSQISNQQRGL